MGYVELQTILEWIDRYGLLAVFVGTVADASGMQMFTVAGGVAAQMREGFSLVLVILAGTLANLTSDLVLYAIGRWRARWLDSVVTSEKGKARLKLIGENMRRFAIPILALGRFLPWFGRFVPAAAGLRYVSFSRALFALTLGGLIGSTLYAMIGYWVGKSIAEFEGLGLWIFFGALVLSVPAARFLLQRFDARVESLLEREGRSADGEGRSQRDADA